LAAIAQWRVFHLQPMTRALVTIGTLTFDEKGKANPIRYFVQYSFALQNQSDQDIFYANSSESSPTFAKRRQLS
jgi:hypothetical protein